MDEYTRWELPIDGERTVKIEANRRIRKPEQIQRIIDHLRLIQKIFHKPEPLQSDDFLWTDD